MKEAPTSHKRLVAYWKSMGMKIAEPTPLDLVRAFEEKHRVRLPEDFRAYYESVNGMRQEGGDDCDPRGFSFWPLSNVQSVTKECSEQSVPTPDIEGVSQYFMFADYFQWSWAYAIRLGETGLEPSPVIHVGTLEPSTVAESFTHFVELYLRDSKELYPRRE